MENPHKKDLQFHDLIKTVEGDLGKTEWITVLEFSDSQADIDNNTYFSALIADDQRDKVLEKYEWDMRIGGGHPGFCSYYKDGKSITEYNRFSDEGVEPIVYWRSFSGKQESFIELSEEYRLYFNLYERYSSDRKKVLIYTSDDGDEDEVAIIEARRVSLKLKYVKEFLAAKRMHLAIYFEAMRFLGKTLEELGEAERDEIRKGDDCIYSLCVRDLNLGKTKSQGWLLGKKLISGARDFNPNFWESRLGERFEEFIIGVDGEGKEVTCSCNSDYQATPGFLTPVFFRREVLKKYYDSPDKFSVEDGSVGRRGFWSLRVMNNHRDHVVAWLGDLKSLPHKEQTHWRSFNLTPGSRKISHADYMRSIEGEFSDPEHPELYFKFKFEIFQEEWNRKFGWFLFKPLSEGDAHHMRSLHVPTTNEQKEFDDQVASITKIMIDSLNEAELSKDLILDKKDPRGIDKFEAFLDSRGFPNTKMIEFFRSLQLLRSSGVAHRKGDNYEKVKRFFGMCNGDLSIVFEKIFIKCIWTLNYLEKHFLSP